LVDLAALRFSPHSAAGHSLPAAGLPWFMTMFGRDSILTSLQALPFTPELAATTLRQLGFRQGTRLDDFRDEDPGRIPHEMRYGEMTAFEERPHSPYYGSADATPLYVVLLDEYERWTGDAELVRQFEYEARAALNWIDEDADLMGNGYISYQRRNEQTGLENQCWKDSWDSISYHDGRLPGFPRATCELQGYAYDAKLRGARLAREIWGDPAYADDLESETADLKQRFNRDFWVEDREFFALALDADGSKVDALSPNVGHLLWSGIVDDSKADAIVRHLLGPRLWSGWGVRTLAVGECRYNPIGYHVGTVWPFDNSFIAGACDATATRRRLPASPPGSWTPPVSSRAGCQRHSQGTGGIRPSTRSSTRPPAARRPGPPAPRYCCCARCSACNHRVRISS
jgi:glycogen debranching enzyme